MKFRPVLFLLGVVGVSSVAQAQAQAPQAVETMPAALKHALVLISPKKVWTLQLEPRSNGFNRWYDRDGNAHPLAYAMDGVTLNQQVLPALAPLGGSASLGDTVVGNDVSLEGIKIALGFGVTEDLTLGGYFTHGRNRNDVAFDIAGGNVGWNPLFDRSQAVGPANYPFAAVGMGANEPLGRAGFEQLLTDPAFGYAYDNISTAKHNGFGELVLGAVWRFYKDQRQGLVLGLGWREGIADDDRPDDLFDIPLEDGSDDLMVHVDWYRELGHGLDSRWMVNRTLQTSDTRTMRVVSAGKLLAPISAKEDLKRDLGDIWEYALELGYSWSDWRTSATWRHWQKGTDYYVSALGTDTSAMSENTHASLSQWRWSISWSGISAFQRSTIPLSVMVKLELQDTYDGRNMAELRDIYLTTHLFF